MEDKKKKKKIGKRKKRKMGKKLGTAFTTSHSRDLSTPLAPTFRGVTGADLEEMYK